MSGSSASSQADLNRTPQLFQNAVNLLPQNIIDGDCARESMGSLNPGKSVRIDEEKV